MEELHNRNFDKIDMGSLLERARTHGIEELIMSYLKSLASKGETIVFFLTWARSWGGQLTSGSCPGDCQGSIGVNRVNPRQRGEGVLDCFFFWKCVMCFCASSHRWDKR